MTLSIIAAKYLVDAAQADSIVAMGRLAKMTRNVPSRLFSRDKTLSSSQLFLATLYYSHESQKYERQFFQKVYRKIFSHGLVLHHLPLVSDTFDKHAPCPSFAPFSILAFV